MHQIPMNANKHLCKINCTNWTPKSLNQHGTKSIIKQLYFHYEVMNIKECHQMWCRYVYNHDRNNLFPDYKAFKTSIEKQNACKVGSPTWRTKRPVWKIQGLMKTAQNWPHWNNSSVFWRKMLSESSITTRSYETKLHAYSLFKVNLNRMLKFSCFS